VADFENTWGGGGQACLRCGEREKGNASRGKTSVPDKSRLARPHTGFAKGKGKQEWREVEPPGVIGQAMSATI